MYFPIFYEPYLVLIATFPRNSVSDHARHLLSPVTHHLPPVTHHLPLVMPGANGATSVRSKSISTRCNKTTISAPPLATSKTIFSRHASRPSVRAKGARKLKTTAKTTILLPECYRQKNDQNNIARQLFFFL